MSRASTFVCLFVLVLLTAAGCNTRAGKLPNYGTVPEFLMSDSEGRLFDSKRLVGKVWVVDFIYTSCPGPCPLMTAKMHRIEQQLKQNPDVKLVSISVDPDHDSPSVLNAFARRFGGPTDNWFFLTGSPATVHLLAYDTFHVGDVISKMDHSTKFMLVDKHGHLRGYYSSLGQDETRTLLDDIAALDAQPS